MLYKYFLIVICCYSVLLHFLRILCVLFKPLFLMKFKTFSRTAFDQFDLLLYYTAMMVVLLQVIWNQLDRIKQ